MFNFIAKLFRKRPPAPAAEESVEESPDSVAAEDKEVASPAPVAAEDEEAESPAPATAESEQAEIADRIVVLRQAVLNREKEPAGYEFSQTDHAGNGKSEMENGLALLVVSHVESHGRRSELARDSACPARGLPSVVASKLAPTGDSRFSR